MSLVFLMSRLSRNLRDEDRIAFRREQINRIGFAGLKPVCRVFMGV